MTTMQAIAFAIEKAPKGGYSLSRITSFREGVAQIEILAYCSTLVEAQAIEHQEKRDLFGEPAWYPTPSRPPIIPAPPQHAASPEHEEFPRVVKEYEANGGVMGTLYGHSNGAMRAVIPALFLAGMWLSTHLRPLVA